MHRHAPSLATFLLFIGVLIFALKVIDWLPAAFQPGVVRRYASLAEAQSTLGIPKIYVPTYFPKTLQWPPSLVLAQTKPFTAVVMEFHRVDSRVIALVITQTASQRLRQRPKIHFKRIRQTSSVNLKGRESVVERGFCDDGESCSQITFMEEDLWISIQMRSSAEELLVLAGSMLSGRAQ
jgi:hypothetical protein